MAIDKKLFYASHGLKYPVVARPYTDDMEVKEKFFTKADVVAILTELQLEIEEKEQHYKDKFLEPNNAVHEAAMGGRMFGCGECKDIIQQKIDKLKEQEDGTNNN